MRRYRLFCPELTDRCVTLPPDESHHAVTVLRIEPGTPVVLFDGAGNEAIGVAARVEPRCLQVDIDHVTYQPFESAVRLTLAVAVPKLHRQAYLIEKCTELGVETIWPIVSERSVAKPSEAAVRRWRRRAIEAAKQAGRAWVPTVSDTRTLRESLDRIGDFAVCGIAHRAEPSLPIGRLLAPLADAASALVLIGPEGGWSDSELSQAVSAGATPTALGPTVLRTETAAVAVCAAVAGLTAERRAGKAKAEHRLE